MSQHTTPPTETPESPQLPEEQPFETAAARRLERIEDGRWIAGVATGLAEYFAVPVWLVRVIFLFLLAPAGVGVLTYLALVLFMPHESEDQSPAERWFGRIDNPERALGIGLAVVAFFIIVGSTTHIDGGVVTGLALLALGVLLYQGGFFGASGGGASQSLASETDHEVDNDGEGPGRSGGRPPRPPRSPRQPREPRQPKAPRPPRPKSNLGAYTFAAMFITLGILGAADITEVLYLKAFHYVAAALTVIGLGLVVGAWRGRSRGLILLGLATLPFLAVTWVTGNVDTIVAEWEAIVSSEDVHDGELYLVNEVDGIERLSFGVGQVTVDLSDVLFTDPSSELNIRMDAGQLTVIVPEGIRVYAHTDLGQIEAPGRQSDGFDISTTFGPNDADGRVDVRLDVGQIVIEEGN